MRVIMKAIGVITLIGIIGIGCDSITDVETTQTPDVQEFSANAAIGHGCDHTVGVGGNIQAEINDATVDDVICLEAGTYSPSSTINVNKDGLTIQGAGPGETIIDAVNHSSYGIITDNGTSGITLQNFTLTGSGSYALKMQYTDNLAIDNVHTVDNYRTGIDLNMVIGATISNVVSTGTQWGNGISISGSNNVTVTNAFADDNAWTGISLYVSGEGDNPGVTNVTISNSIFSNNGQAGLQVENSQSDEESAFENILIEGNYFSGNEGSVYIRGSMVGGFSDQNVNSDGITIYNNNLLGGILHAGTGTLNAANNWWGHASGPGGPDGRTNPAGNTVGKGSVIAGNVDFNPWLRKSIDHPSN